MSPKIDNNAPVLREYVARAVPINTGEGWIAEFGFPGGSVAPMLDNNDKPIIFTTEVAALNNARRVLINALNSRTRFSSKRELSIKMNGDDFAAELGETSIPLSEFAMFWGTKQENVVAWIQGEKEVPFPLRWVLRLLRNAESRAYVRRVVASNIHYKPEWAKRQRQRAENEEEGR